MDVLQAWQHASTIVLSCPGPLGRHPKALLPLSDLALPQAFLGCESQLRAFAAAAPAETRQKMLFAPLPEMFSGPHGLDAAFRALDRTPSDPAQIVHLRFGSVRDARVLKGVGNAAVLAERGSAPPLTASQHPFASGAVLPAAMRGVFQYGPAGAHQWRAGHDALAHAELPPDCITADLVAAPPDPAGLHVVSLADFDSDLWAAGTVPAFSPALRGAILLPWNLTHFGSIVPDLLIRLATLWQPGAMPPLVMLPFNYLGQTGVLRQSIARLREATRDGPSLLSRMYFARVTRLGGLAPLRKWARAVWVDGNDPESWWTMARFHAIGMHPILIDPALAASGDERRVVADEAIWVEADTRHGKLTFAARLPSRRALPELLSLTTAFVRR